MRKMSICFTLAVCLVVLFSGIAPLCGQNVAQAFSLPFISVYPLVIDLGEREMGSSFSGSFSVSLSSSYEGGLVFVGVYPNGVIANPISF